MKKTKVLLSFTKLSDAGLDVKANAVLTAMTGNSDFPEPQPSLEVFASAVKNFSEAISAAQTRHKVSIVAKNDMRLVLVQVMHDLAAFVNFHANGDRLIIVRSGFDASAAFRSPKLLGEVKNFEVLPGRNSGEAILSIKSVQYALSYLYFYSPAPVMNNAWQHLPGAGCSLVITNLEPGRQYSFRIGITGTYGQMVHTDIITRMVV